MNLGWKMPTAWVHAYLYKARMRAVNMMFGPNPIHTPREDDMPFGNANLVRSKLGGTVKRN